MRTARFLGIVGCWIGAVACSSGDPPAEMEDGGAGAGGELGSDGGGGSEPGAGGGGSTNGGGAQGGAPQGGAAEGGAGEGAAVPYPDPDWQVDDPAAHGFDPAGLAAAAAFAETEDSYCLLVFRHGALVSESYFNGHSATSADKSWSIAKSYSSALVGIALERGEIQSLDQSVADFVPAWRNDARSLITVRHLVSMTSGLEWSAFQDYVAMATFADDHTAFAEDLEADVAPGTAWTYHNGGVQMLEPVLRAATGMTMEQYAAEHLWSKIGSTATWSHDPAGNPTAYANVLASCRDHARLGYLYLHGGRWKGQQVIPSAWIEASLTPSQEMNRAYGYLFWLNGQAPAMNAMGEPWEGWMVPFAPPDLFAARGFGNQFIDVIPSLDLMVVRFGEDPTSSVDLIGIAQDQKFERHDAILHAVLDAIVD